MRKRGYNLKELEQVLKLLQAGKPLSPKHCDHELVGNYRGFRECHIAPDWLLIYLIRHDRLVLVCSRTGTHSDLF